MSYVLATFLGLAFGGGTAWRQHRRGPSWGTPLIIFSYGGILLGALFLFPGASSWLLVLASAVLVGYLAIDIHCYWDRPWLAGMTARRKLGFVFWHGAELYGSIRER